MAGTAAATLLVSSASLTYAAGMEVFNLTARNLEVVFGPDTGTAAYTSVTIAGTPILTSGNGIVFCPGTASATVASGRGSRFPIIVPSGVAIYVRTTENTPITCSAVQPLVISFWA